MPSTSTRRAPHRASSVLTQGVRCVWRARLAPPSQSMRGMDRADEAPVHAPGGVAPVGVPGVLEQKTTILWKRLYFLVSLQDSLAGVGWTRRTAAVGKQTPCMGVRPRYTWTKSEIFVHHRCGRSPSFSSSSWMAQVEIVVCCTLAQGTPIAITVTEYQGFQKAYDFFNPLDPLLKLVFFSGKRQR